MKYYIIERAEFVNDISQPGLDGRNVENKEKLFNRACGPNSFFEEDPIFDYLVPLNFHQEDEDKDPAIICDFNYWWGESPRGGWLKPVSEKFKDTLDLFNLPEHRFYPAKVLFNGIKHQYYVLQVFRKTYLDHLDFSKTRFNNLYQNEVLNFDNKVIESFISMPEVESYFGDKFNFDWSYERVVVQPSFKKVDFITFKKLGDLVSERLKNAIESAGLTGVEFHELPIPIEFSDEI